MALLNRGSQDQAQVPEEIQEYYQTERRERAGVAWLLAIGTLLMTIVLAAGIFFTGRWAYRKINDGDSDTTQVAQQNPQALDVLFCYWYHTPPLGPMRLMHGHALIVFCTFDGRLVLLKRRYKGIEDL